MCRCASHSTHLASGFRLQSDGETWGRKVPPLYPCASIRTFAIRSTFCSLAAVEQFAAMASSSASSDDGRSVSGDGNGTSGVCDCRPGTASGCRGSLSSKSTYTSSLRKVSSPYSRSGSGCGWENRIRYFRMRFAKRIVVSVYVNLELRKKSCTEDQKICVCKKRGFFFEINVPSQQAENGLFRQKVVSCGNKNFVLFWGTFEVSSSPSCVWVWPPVPHQISGCAPAQNAGSFPSLSKSANRHTLPKEELGNLDFTISFFAAAPLMTFPSIGLRV